MFNFDGSPTAPYQYAVLVVEELQNYGSPYVVCPARIHKIQAERLVAKYAAMIQDGYNADHSVDRLVSGLAEKEGLVRKRLTKTI